jgi:hypothetical protein
MQPIDYIISNLAFEKLSYMVDLSILMSPRRRQMTWTTPSRSGKTAETFQQPVKRLKRFSTFC